MKKVISPGFAKKTINLIDNIVYSHQKDLKGNPLLLFINSWSVGMVLERNPDLKLAEFGRA